MVEGVRPAKMIWRHTHTDTALHTDRHYTPGDAKETDKRGREKPAAARRTDRTLCAARRVGPRMPWLSVLELALHKGRAGGALLKKKKKGRRVFGASFFFELLLLLVFRLCVPSRRARLGGGEAGLCARPTSFTSL